MRKKIKKYSVNYEALERVRVYEMEQMEIGRAHV